MMSSSPLLSRLMAYSLLLFCMLVLWVVILAPISSAMSDKLALYESLSHQIARYEALQSQKSDTEVLLSKLKGDTLDSWTFKGQAAAELQRLVRQAASKQGLTLSNSRSVGLAEMGNFNRVGINLTVQGRHEQIYEFLADLRATKPLMTLEDLMLRSQGSRAGVPVVLSLQMQVYGYQLREPIEMDEAPPRGDNL